MNDFDWSIVRNPTFLRKLPIRNVADRDDAIQDACVKLLGKPITPELLWTATLNCYKDRVKAEDRRRAREQRRTITGLRPVTDHNHTRDSKQLPRHTEASIDDPSARLHRREIRAAIKRAVRTARLSRDHRCALWAWVRGRVAEFARRRRIREVTVRVWATRARAALRPHLEREGLAPIETRVAQASSSRGHEVLVGMAPGVPAIRPCPRESGCGSFPGPE